MADEDYDMYDDGHEDFSDGSGEHSTCAASHAHIMAALGSAQLEHVHDNPVLLRRLVSFAMHMQCPSTALAAYFLSCCLHLGAVCTAPACWPGDPSCHI